MKDSVPKKISTMIYDLAFEENKELLKLTENGMGLKKMPELAFAYECGKAIFRNRKTILNSSDYTWERELVIEKGLGPSDLVFLSEDSHLPHYVIEFKLDDTWHKYKADIKKLKEIKDENCVNIFCSFKHVFKYGNTDQSIGFIEILQTEFGNEAVMIQDELFKTKISNKPKDHFFYTSWLVK